MKLLAASDWLLVKEPTTKRRQHSALSFQLSSQNQMQDSSKLGHYQTTRRKQVEATFFIHTSARPLDQSAWLGGPASTLRVGRFPPTAQAREAHPDAPVYGPKSCGEIQASQLTPPRNQMRLGGRTVRDLRRVRFR